MSFPHSIILANISRKTCASYGFLFDLLQTQSFSLEIKLSSWLQHCLCQKAEKLLLDRLSYKQVLSTLLERPSLGSKCCCFHVD